MSLPIAAPPLSLWLVPTVHVRLADVRVRATNGMARVTDGGRPDATARTMMTRCLRRKRRRRSWTSPTWSAFSSSSPPSPCLPLSSTSLSGSMERLVTRRSVCLFVSHRARNYRYLLCYYLQNFVCACVSACVHVNLEAFYIYLCVKWIDDQRWINPVGNLLVLSPAGNFPPNSILNFHWGQL